MTERQQVEQALGESEQRYRRLLAATTDYIYTVKVERGCSGATVHGPGCAAVTGYTSAEFAADSYLWFRVIHVEDREAVLAQANRILAGEEPPPLEHRLVHKQGGVRWVRNTPIPRRDAEGHLIAYDGLISDITSRKRAEMFITVEHTVMATLATASRLDAALPTVLQALGTILLWHFVGCWHWNNATKELQLQAVWSRPPLPPDVGSPSPLDIRTRVATTGQPVWIADAAQTGGGQFFTGTAELHGGSLIPVQVEGAVASVLELWSRETLAPDAELLQVLVTVGAQLGQFIGRQRALENLKHERHLLRTVVDNLPDCIFVKDTESRFLLNNVAHLRMLGATTPEEALGKTDRIFSRRSWRRSIGRMKKPSCVRANPCAITRSQRWIRWADPVGF